MRQISHSDFRAVNCSSLTIPAVQWSLQGVLLAGLLLVGLLPPCAEAQVIHLVETYTPPSPVENGYFGFSVARVKDIDGDGTPDLLVGASGESTGGKPGAGRTYLISGASGEVTQTFTSPNAQKNGRFGSAITGVGDANGDDIPDLLVGAERENRSGKVGAGRAYLLSGSTGEVIQTLASPNPEEGGHFGHALAEVGDMNDDGTPDLLVGAPEESPDGKAGAGRAYLISGASAEVIQVFVSPNVQRKGLFGSSVAGAGVSESDAPPT